MPRRNTLEPRRGLPAYDPLLRAFHRAFAPELSRAVAGLPLAPGSAVLDLACGDGFYTRRLARRAGPAGLVVAGDLNPAYLRRARRASGRDGRAAPVTLARVDAYRLPFPDAAFDLVWCAQSFLSLDPERALREMRRVVKPSGQVAVLENDPLHHVLLPWPVPLEVAVLGALERAGPCSPGREVNRLFREAGLCPRRKKTVAADRQAPFSPAVRRFLTLHLRWLRRLAGPLLSPGERRRLREFGRGVVAQPLPGRPDAELTCLMTLFRAGRRG